MEATPIDPRETSWESDFPAFRVYFWRGSIEPGRHPAQSAWASDEWRLVDADIHAVLEWADEHANGRYVTIWVEATDNGSLGMIRLHGWEPVRPDLPPGDRVQLVS